MRSRLTVVLFAMAVALAIPAVAGASPPASKLLIVQQGSAMARVLSNRTVPYGFHSSAGEAIRAAERSPILRELHRRLHPLLVMPYVWRSDNPYWYVIFTFHGRIVGDAEVNRAGQLVGAWTGPQADAPYTHGHLDPVLNSWLMLVPSCLLFMLAFLDPRRLRRLAHLDAVAVLAFLASYEFMARGDLEPAVWTVYPPLVYLLLRLLRIGSGHRATTGRIAPLLTTRRLMVGLPLLLAGRIAFSLLGHQEIDVGYESVIGAFRILHHLPLYWPDLNHGDTYGPITYLAYAPFELLFPWVNSLSNLHAADAAAIFFDLGTVVGLVLLGRRLRVGSEGTRLGLLLGWAWAACPFTVIGLLVHTNDGLISMLSVFALLALASPLASGALLGLAAAAKFSPAALLPLIASPRRRGLKGAVLCTTMFAAVVAVAIFSWLPPQGFGYFWQRTLGFQLTRIDVFSPWALHSGLHPIQIAVEVLAVLLAGVVAFVPRERPLVRVAALAGAVTIAIQIPAMHWFYYYILWFLPFALVALLVPTKAQAVEASGQEPGGAQMKVEDHRTEPDRVLVGA